MENISMAVLRAFDLKCISAVKHKAGFVCKTDIGRVSVLRAPQEPARIWFRYNVKEHLHRCGFESAGRLFLSAEGEPFAACEGERFVVTPCPPHRESSFANAEEWWQVVRTVARMHLACKDMELPPVPPYAGAVPSARGQADANALSSYKRRILKKGKYSEFDILFLRTFDEQMAALAQWQAAVAAPDFAAQMGEGRSVCHNLLKEENMLVAADGAVMMRNFSECAPGHFVMDLAALVKRYMKALPSAPVALDEVLALYDRENPLRGESLAFLRAALAFPDKYIKLCTQYYERNRTWTPGAFISRMEELTRGMETGKAYLQASKALF